MKKLYSRDTQNNMPCTKCNADFNLINWKIKCIECEDLYCFKCVKKQEGHYFCGICLILIKRPPNREQLMELKSKDLQQYLNKYKISTHGLVEKTELVELFCHVSIPVRYKKSNKKFPVSLGGSVPDLAARSQLYFNNLRSNAGNAFQYSFPHPHSWFDDPSSSATSSPTRPAREQHDHPSVPTPRTNSYNIPENGAASSQQQQEQTLPETVPTAPPEEYRPPKKLLRLSDFTSEDQLNELSVKQLKELLTLNRVDYKGCVEKSELLDRVVMLWVDNNSHKNHDFGGNLDDCCKICMDAALDCVLLECGHMATCIECGKKLAECPICRQYVTRVVRTFKA